MGIPLGGPVQIMRCHKSGDVPAALLPGQICVNEYDGILFFPDATTTANSSGQYTTIIPVPLKAVVAALSAVRSLALGGTGVAASSSGDLLTKLGAQPALGFTPENAGNKGQANGYAQLGSDGKLPVSLIPSAIAAALEFAGTWDANANSPALASGTGTKGSIYVVATAGTATLDGLSQWNVGDWAIFDGAKWRKLDGLASEVLSVAGLVGAITATSLKTALSLAAGDIGGLGNAATRSVGTTTGTVAAGDDARFSTGGGAGLPSAFASKSASYTVVAGDAGTQFTLTGSATLTLPSASSFGAGKAIFVKKTDGSGAWTIAGTVDGKTNIQIYSEGSYALVSDGTNWQSQGRPKGWITVGTTTIAATVSTLTLNAGFTDPELRDMRFVLDGLVSPSTTNDKLALRVQKNGAYGTNAYANVTTTNNASTVASTYGSAYHLISSAFASYGVFGEIDLPLFGSTSALGQRLSAKAFSATLVSDTTDGVHAPGTPGAITGIQIYCPGGQSLSGGIISQRGYRQ